MTSGPPAEPVDLDELLLEERLRAPSLFVRIVEALDGGLYRLWCGHTVSRSKRPPGARVLCEYCFPLNHARATQQYRAARGGR